MLPDIKAAYSEELEALTTRRKKIIVDFLHSGPFSASGAPADVSDEKTATFDSLQKAFSTQYSAVASELTVDQI